MADQDGLITPSASFLASKQGAAGHPVAPSRVQGDLRERLDSHPAYIPRTPAEGCFWGGIWLPMPSQKRPLDRVLAGQGPFCGVVAGVGFEPT
jgi:hypothetical protein